MSIPPSLPASVPIPVNDLEQTAVDRRWALGFVGFFLLVLSGIPVADVMVPAFTRDVSAESVHQRIAVVQVALNPPSLREYPFPIQTAGAVLAEPARRIEQEIEAGSAMKQWMQPRLQEWLTTVCSTGNHQVQVGTDGWLFFRPGIDHLAGTGFLHRTRPHPGSQTADPRRVILDFHRQCQAAGVALLVVPISDKAAIEHRHLTTEVEPVHPYANVDFTQWVNDLTVAGVNVIPVADLLHDHAQVGKAFLPDDTHWTPAAMGAVARLIATHRVFMSVTRTASWQIEVASITGRGDLAALLRLPLGSALFPPSIITIERVVDASTGAPWASDHQAPVVLLGDSFANIFQTPSLGWGEAAGLGAHLAQSLGTGVDVIAINGDGVNGTRRRLAMRTNPLQGKQVVVWVFAERELSNAQWSFIALGKHGAP